MSNFLKYLIIITFIFLNACGYKVYNPQKNYYLGEIKTNGNNRIASAIRNNIKLETQKDNSNILEGSISVEVKKNTKEKSMTGKVISYTITMNTTLDLNNKKNDKKIIKTINQNSSFDVGTHHSTTIKNEKRILDVLITKTSEEIDEYLVSIFKSDN